MKKIIFSIIMIMTLALTSQVYACCGGATITQYEGVSSSNEWYQKAANAAGEYLKLQSVQGDKTLELQFNANNQNTEQNNNWAWQKLDLNKTLTQFVGIVYMFDHDYNVESGNTTGEYIGGLRVISDTNNNASHKACEVDSGCHLNQSAQTAGSYGVNTCRHHKCHWNNTIVPTINNYRSAKEGS